MAAATSREDKKPIAEASGSSSSSSSTAPPADNSLNVPLLSRHTQDTSEGPSSSSSGNPNSATPLTLEDKLAACQEEADRIDVQIYRVKHRLSMRKVGAEMYSTQKCNYEDRLWTCQRKKKELESKHKMLLKETKASEAKVATLTSKIESLKKTRSAELRATDLV